MPPSGSSILIDEPSLSEHIDGLIGLLLWRFVVVEHIIIMEAGRFHEGVVFGGGIFVVSGAAESAVPGTKTPVSDEDALPPSLTVRLRDGKLSLRSRFISSIPAAGGQQKKKKNAYGGFQN